MADRHDRISLMAVGGVFGIALAIVFTALAASGHLSYPALLLLNLGFALRTGLFGAATQSALKDVVPAASLGRAQASNQGRDAVLNLVGSPLGGVLLGWGSAALAGVMALCQAAAAATALLLRRRVGGAQLAADPRARSSFVDELLEGLRWVLGRRDLRGVMIVSTLINLGFNAATTTVVYSLQQSGARPATIGLVSAAVGVGMLVGATLAPGLVPRVASGWLAIGGIGVAAAGMTVLPLFSGPVAIAVVMGASMLGVPAVNAALLGYFMVATPGDLIGRAMSAITVFAMGAMPLAPLLAGMGLTWLGRGPTLIASALVCLAAGVLALLSRGLREIPAEKGWAEHAEAQGVAGSQA